jgi:hypothetical protein
MSTLFSAQTTNSMLAANRRTTAAPTTTAVPQPIPTDQIVCNQVPVGRKEIPITVAAAI